MTINTSPGLLRSVSRSNILQNVLAIFREKAIPFEYPMNIEFTDEMAVDTGGVTREMFSLFWEKCYETMFDGCSLLVPMVCPQTDGALMPILGKIISHGYLVCGHLPMRIALPCLVGILCGSSAPISDSIICDAFLDYISCTERAIFNDALSNVTRNSFLPCMQEKLLNTLSRYVINSQTVLL